MGSVSFGSRLGTFRSELAMGSEGFANTPIRALGGRRAAGISDRHGALQDRHLPSVVRHK